MMSSTKKLIACALTVTSMAVSGAVFAQGAGGGAGGSAGGAGGGTGGAGAAGAGGGAGMGGNSGGAAGMGNGTGMSQTTHSKHHMMKHSGTGTGSTNSPVNNSAEGGGK